MLPELFRVHYETPGDPGAGPAPTQPPAAATGPTAPPAAPNQPAAPAAPAEPTVDFGERIKQLEKENGDLRRESAGYRTRNKGELAEFGRQMAKLLGAEAVTDPAAATDPVAAMARLEKRDAEREEKLRRALIDVALGDVYSKVGVKPELTRAMLEYKGALKDLSPDDPELGKTLHAAVKQLADGEPSLRVGQAPPAPTKSGGAFPGGSNNATPQLSREDLKGMNADEINAAREKGQLNQLLGRST